MAKPPAVLIAAASGRALAASARRAGYAPLVIDFFGDDDTRRCAAACICLAEGMEHGFQADRLLAACDRLVGSKPIVGAVCGTGFEDRPALLDLMAQRWRLLGNEAAIVARIKDPSAFAALCRDCGIAHPEISFERPAEASSWLARRRGGAGGGHVHDASDAAHLGAATYYQKRVDGRPISALVLADRTHGAVLGFSEQWAAPCVGQPYRYGGAVRPAALDAATARVVEAAIERLVPRASLVGLNSMDFLVAREHFWLLEINPRPGATMDLFEDEDTPGGGLFALHLAACNGAIGRLCLRAPARAAAIVYADRDIPLMPSLDWPEWAFDRQPAGSSVARGAPICTIVADGSDARQARRRLQQRSAAALASVSGRAA